MANMSSIRSHIKSVRQTRQITNAMYLISAARMRKAVKRIEQNKAYFCHALDTMIDIRGRTDMTDHPYISHRAGDKTAYLIIASDRGLAGSYNHNILSLAGKNMNGKNVTHIMPVGEMADLTCRNSGKYVDEQFIGAVNNPAIHTVRRIVNRIMSLYNSGDIDEMHVVYTRFVNSLYHEPTDTKLLPVELSDFDKRDRPKVRREILYDPSPEEVFDSVIPQFMIGFIYGALIHSFASENCARMNAMENATHSADDMIKSLILKYNSVRQMTITNELSEIISASNLSNQKGGSYE